jgi:hypothetical protein
MAKTDHRSVRLLNGVNHLWDKTVSEYAWFEIGRSLCAGRMVITDRNSRHVVSVMARTLVGMTHKDSLLHAEASDMKLWLRDTWSGRTPHAMRAHLVAVRKRWRRQNPQG